MSSFTCQCGERFRDAEESPDATGILLGLSALANLEQRVARAIVEFQCLAGSQRDTWLRERFGADYPTDRAADEVVHDIISQAVNSSKFSSKFFCSKCRRFAVAFGPERRSWSFYFPE